jgi:hypothetical protein
MKRLAVFSAVVILSANTVMAQQVTLDFTGVVNNVTQGGPPEFPDVGDPVTGFVTYDLSTPDTDPRFDTGRYQPNLPGGLFVQVGSLQISLDEYFVSVFNRVPGENTFDALTFGGISPPLFGSPSNTITSIGFQSFRDVMNSSTLPSTFDLAELDQVDAAGVVFDNDTQVWRVDFTVLSLRSRPIPEPSSLVCVCVALAGLIGWRRGCMLIDRKHVGVREGN